MRIFYFYLVPIVLLTSCKSYHVTWTEYLQQEIKYYKFKEGSSILDFSIEQRSIPALIATTQDSLHFYLGHGERSKYGPLSSPKIPQDTFEDFKKKYNSDNKVSFTIIEQKSDSLLLAGESMDYILCRDYLHLFNSFERIVNEWHRVLKPKGQIFLKGQFNENIKLPNSSPLKNLGGIIKYIEESGFFLISTDTIIYNKHMKNVTEGRMTLLCFGKK